MILFSTAAASPAEHLACDEALLDFSEENGGPGFLRLWESASYFAVLGYSKKVAAEVHAGRCAELKIPVLRRTSGGGTVLQGPGCSNYSVVLPLQAAPELEQITGANCYVMKRIREAVTSALRTSVEIQGCTDLTLGGRKFSGNAQRRKRRYLLFHGSFLLNFNLRLISETLQLPADQPKYRARREHADFLINIPVASNLLGEELQRVWRATEAASDNIVADIARRSAQLVESKYGRDDWNLRF